MLRHAFLIAGVFLHAGAVQAAGELPARLVGHGGPVQSVAVSADGREALTSSFDYSVILWRLEGDEGAIDKRLIGHDAGVNDVAFVPGRRMAVSVGDDSALIVWDLGEGTLLKRFAGEGEKVLGVAASPDGRLAATASWDGTARLYDLDSLEETAVLSGHRGNVNSVAFSSDGKRLYTASYDGTVREWDTATGTMLRPIVNHGWGVNVVGLINGGLHLVYGATDGVLSVVDLTPERVVHELVRFERPVLSLAVTDDGSQFGAGAGDGTVKVFGSTDLQERESHIVAYGPVWGLDFTPTGDWLYHAGLDDFAIGMQVRPRVPFDAVKSEFPRRFQLESSDDPGEVQFRRKCSVCHTLRPDDKNRAGPTLYRIFGRRAGSLPGYPYSDALLDSSIVWDEDTITQLFDHGPDVVTPGTKMPIQRIKRPEDRDNLIRFLKRVAGTHEAVAE